ncbi:MAG: fibrobacter succinogenes major paralogous domain-containing protein [Paludibacteraceae bacterium]|nr:fibrobacter succinogenes major paralogous domain-containing protein [Paludibacteraceae bacterium]
MKNLVNALVAGLVIASGSSSCSVPFSPTVSGESNGHEFVDLELPSGRIWATYNLGAAKPEENGAHYAWGETSPKSSFDWENYQLGNGSDSKTKVTKYCVNDRKGEVDNKKVLEPTDDAATAAWGGDWRIPTLADWNELEDACEWHCVRNYNGTGLDVKIGTSKKNGNSILFPFAGYYTGGKLIEGEGFYWTSTLYEENSLQAYSARVLTGNINTNNNFRKLGNSIRAVR